MATLPVMGREVISDRLLDAIMQVESGGKADAVGDNGEAVGAYQLHRIYVDEVNRILYITSKQKNAIDTYGYADRLDRDKSRSMTLIYLTYWAKYHKLTDPAQIARLHNGGCFGNKKKATIKYGQKVMAQMRKGK
jgi:hypothetical protein